MKPARKPFRRWVRRWIYLLFVALLALAVLYHYARGPRRIPGGPAIIVPKLPPYARQIVTLDGQPRNLPEWCKELATQSKTTVEFLDDPSVDNFQTKQVPIEKPGTYTLADAFSILTNAWTVQDKEHPLSLDYAEDRITVGTPEALQNSKRVETRIYPIGDLLENQSAFITATTHIGRVTQLKLFIISFCHPDTWSETGGTIGTISDLGDRLIINQTPGAHWEIQQLLDSLRKFP